MHEVLVNRLGGLSLPRKSVVRLTDRPDMTLDVYRGGKTTMQQQQQPILSTFCFLNVSQLFMSFHKKLPHFWKGSVIQESRQESRVMPNGDPE